MSRRALRRLVMVGLQAYTGMIFGCISQKRNLLPKFKWKEKTDDRNQNR